MKGTAGKFTVNKALLQHRQLTERFRWKNTKKAESKEKNQEKLSERADYAPKSWRASKESSYTVFTLQIVF